MLEKNGLLDIIEAHAQNIRLVNIVRVLTLKSDLAKSFYEIIDKEAIQNPGFTKSILLLENTDNLIHTVKQLYWMAVRTAVTECFELTRNYCIKTKQGHIMEKQTWFRVVKILRNALNHDFCINFGKYDMPLLPLEWKEIRLDISMDKQELSHKIFPESAAFEWLETLENFINDELV